MTASSGSWSGAPRAGAADIIDLDRYMRATRPARRPDPMHERLVVDGGLAGARKLVPTTLSALSSRTMPTAPSVPTAPTVPSSGTGSGCSVQSGGDADKRFSHDSGLSDTSYARRPLAHRPHRYRCAGGKQLTPAEKVRTRASSASLRAFRAALEHALREQQAQIARVAQLCERQAERCTEKGTHADRTERATRAERGSRADRVERGKRADHANRAERSREHRSCTDSDSDLSSSSRSTNPRHRSTDCKTYKIIMSKLDELNRLFATRRASPPPAPRPPPPPRRDSSDSVTVSDKLVATDFPHVPSSRVCGRRASSKRLVERGAGGEIKAIAGAGAGAGAGANTRVITCALSLDIPPTNGTSAGRGSSSEVNSGGGSDPSLLRGKFDLDNPVHLYAQAKRLQALHATSRRTRSADAPRSSALGSGVSGLGSGAKEVSLCALCRAYWRLARRCLTAPLGAMRGA